MGRALVAVAIMAAFAPVARADLGEEIVYLLPDGSDRYRPVLDNAGNVTLIANRDSITPPGVSADGSRVAFSGAIGDESLGRFAIFVANANGTGLAQLTNGDYGEFDPAWSPDGSSIVASQNQFGSLSSSGCCRLIRINASNGVVTALTARVGVSRPSYSPEGTFVVYDTPSGVFRISPNGGSATLIATSGFDATVSPSEGTIAYLARSGSSTQIRTAPSGGGSATTIYTTSNQLEAPIWSGDRIYFLEHAGLGYDGRKSVTLRSVSQSGGGGTVERTFNTHVVGVTAALADPAGHGVGDINDDGEDDIGVTGPVNRTALLSTGNDFDDDTWGTLDPATGWGTHLDGDFDGDGQSDVASFLGSNGTWHVAIAGSGSYSTSVWDDFSTASGWKTQVAGDFTGDGRDDIANFHPSNGTWWLSRSTGSSFALDLWADYSTASGWTSQVVGDFTGDGRDDIANFHPSNGTWWVSRSTGSSSVLSLWADFSAASGWKTQVVGDFDGDGRDDIANFHPANGTWWVSRSTGSSFVTSLWADFSTASGWSSQVVGDFNGDGRDDIANFHPSNGTWWVSRSTGSSFTTSLWDDFSTASGWDPQMAGDFDGNGRDDIANLHRATGAWWVSESTGSAFVTTRWHP